MTTCGRGHLVGCIDPTRFLARGAVSCRPPFTRMGTAGRNLLHGPGAETVNWSLFKNFPIQGTAEVPVSLRDVRAVQPFELRQPVGDDQHFVVRQYHEFEFGRARHTEHPVGSETAVLIPIGDVAGGGAARYDQLLSQGPQVCRITLLNSSPCCCLLAMQGLPSVVRWRATTDDRFIGLHPRCASAR